MCEQFGGDVAHGAFGLFLGLGPARAAERVQRRMRLARADVFADQMRLGDGHVKLGGGSSPGSPGAYSMTRHSWPALAFAPVPSVGLVPAPDGQHFQTEISPDAVLQMHDEVAFLQFGEINVQRGTGGQRVRRFQPARPLDLVTAENLRVGDDDQLGLVAEETAGQRADLSLKAESTVDGTCIRLRLLDG